jgi:L-threonylcarbamoyladenylate synthase
VNTQRLIVDIHDLESAESQAAIARAAEILRSGGLVAFPTETVYGLGANALDPAAVVRIFHAKQRPAWDPLIVHIADAPMLSQVAANIPPCAHRLMKAFWPGPLTLLVPRHPQVPTTVTAGRARIGIRMPAHPIALALIRAAGVPIAAPSANTFGHTSPTSAAHVLEDLDGRIDAVLDGGETSLGLESTVVDACESPLIIYRPGAITLTQVAAVGGEARMFDSTAAPSTTQPESQPSPGISLRHYAPRARLILIEGEGPQQQSAFANAVANALERGEQVGLMLPDDSAETAGGAELVFRWGAWADLDQLAHRLFAGLRQLDAAGATVIVCPVPPATGIGVAIRDRLRKAAR